MIRLLIMLSLMGVSYVAAQDAQTFAGVIHPTDATPPGWFVLPTRFFPVLPTSPTHIGIECLTRTILSQKKAYMPRPLGSFFITCVLGFLFHKVFTQELKLTGHTIPTARTTVQKTSVQVSVTLVKHMMQVYAQSGALTSLIPLLTCLGLSVTSFVSALNMWLHTTVKLQHTFVQQASVSSDKNTTTCWDIALLHAYMVQHFPLLYEMYACGHTPAAGLIYGEGMPRGTYHASWSVPFRDKGHVVWIVAEAPVSAAADKVWWITQHINTLHQDYDLFLVASARKPLVRIPVLWGQKKDVTLLCLTDFWLLWKKDPLHQDLRLEFVYPQISDARNMTGASQALAYISYGDAQGTSLVYEKPLFAKEKVVPVSRVARWLMQGTIQVKTWVNSAVPLFSLHTPRARILLQHLQSTQDRLQALQPPHTVPTDVYHEDHAEKLYARS